MKARIFQIQRMSLHDGPGIRTTVFFKGCNLRCVWCHNPESIDGKPQTGWNAENCIGCGTCALSCDGGARSLENGRLIYERSRCTDCGCCAKVCPAEAAIQIGSDMETEEIAAEVIKDKKMYEISQGGVTCSGGEPLLQADAVAELLSRLKRQDIHTAVDTAGNVPFSAFEKVLPYTDIFLYDLKHWDGEKHCQYTGVKNDLILENFERLAAEKTIFVRIPFVKGIQEEAIPPIARFLAGKKNVRLVELLPYHRLGENKYGIPSKAAMNLEPPSEQTLREAAGFFDREGIPVKISGMT